jgi:hypothetical protein
LGGSIAILGIGVHGVTPRTIVEVKSQVVRSNLTDDKSHAVTLADSSTQGKLN